LEPLPVSARGGADDIQKDFSERAGIGISNLPSGSLGGLLAELQQFLRLCYPQPLGIIRRGQSRGLLKAPQEYALLEP